MNITMIGSLPPIVGISQYVDGLVRELSRSVHIEFINFKSIYPELLYPGRTKDPSRTEPAYRNVNVRTVLTWYNPFSWLRAGLSLKGDLVHAQWWSYVLAPAYLTILFLAKLRRKTILVTFHNVQPHEKSRLARWANRIMVHVGHHFVVHSEASRRSLMEDHGIGQDRISVVPHGALAPGRMTGMGQGAARDELGIGEGRPVLLLFGHIRAYKGVDVAIQALPHIRREVPDVLLLIAGKPWESWDRYQQIIDQQGLEDHVFTHLDFIPDDRVEGYFAAADIVLLPYRYFDAQSGVASLAVPFKKAMVVTDVGGLPEIVRDRRAVSRPNDPEELARTVVTVLRDRVLREELEADAGRLAEELSWRSIATRTSQLYEELERR